MKFAVRNASLAAMVFVICWTFVHRATQAQISNTKLQDEALSRIAIRIDDFLGEIANDDIDTAIDSLLVRSPLQKDTKKVSLLKDGIRREIPKYGAYMGLEQLRLERVGRSLVRGVYLYQCLDYPVIWNFTFYRSEDEGGWRLISLQFSVDYGKLAA